MHKARTPKIIAKPLWLLATVLLALPIYSASAAPSSKPLIIGGVMSMPTPPYSWIDPCTGKPTGSALHTLDKILQELDIPYEIAAPIAMNMTELRQTRSHLLEGKYDALIAVMETRSTTEMLLSKVPIVVLQDAILYRKSNRLNLNSADDIKGLTGGVVNLPFRPSSTNPVVKWLKSKEVAYKLKPSRKDAFAALMSGEVDFIIIERYRAIATFMDKEQQKSLDLVPIPSSIRKLYFAMAANSPHIHLMPAINKKLVEFEHSGRAETLRYTYLRSWLRMGDCQSPL